MQFKVFHRYRENPPYVCQLNSQNPIKNRKRFRYDLIREGRSTQRNCSRQNGGDTDRLHLLLHGRTFLRTHAVVEEVLACDAVALFRACAATGAKKMATLARIGPEAPALPTLRRTVCLGVLLTVLRPLAPAALLAALIAWRTGAFRRREIVHVRVRCIRPGDYFVPVDLLDVAQVVVVVYAHAPVEDIWQIHV